METDLLPAKYADGTIPCGCCAYPLGAGGQAARTRLCFDCENFKFVQYAAKHDPAKCAMDRATVAGIVERMARGEEVPAYVELPSGRGLQTREPDDASSE